MQPEFYSISNNNSGTKLKLFNAEAIVSALNIRQEFENDFMTQLMNHFTPFLHLAGEQIYLRHQLALYWNNVVLMEGGDKIAFIGFSKPVGTDSTIEVSGTPFTIVIPINELNNTSTLMDVNLLVSKYVLNERPVLDSDFNYDTLTPDQKKALDCTLMSNNFNNKC